MNVSKIGDRNRWEGVVGVAAGEQVLLRNCWGRLLGALVRRRSCDAGAPVGWKWGYIARCCVCERSRSNALIMTYSP
jgi:hypothetical protein